MPDPDGAAAVPVAIVGGGPTGMALALALRQRGIASQILEARERNAGSGDRRILALSYGSRQILESLGVWARLDVTPIAAIHVSQRGRFGRTRLDAAEQGLPALGYVTSAACLNAGLEAALLEAGLPYRDGFRVDRVVCSDDGVQLDSAAGTVRAALVVHANAGGQLGSDDPAATWEHDYEQSAVICTVEVAQAQRHVAYERFTAAGPLALLPKGDGYALIYTCPAATAAELAGLAEAEFLARLQAHFGARLRFVGAGKRQAVGLKLRMRRSVTGARAVWLGNAAQTLHPVAGQGYNLALRDVVELARCVDRDDPGEVAALARYAAARRSDRIATVAGTDALARLFVMETPLATCLRSAAMLAVDLVPPWRRFLVRRMIFGARAF